MKGWQASDRWGCSHFAPQSCPWCEGTDAEVWRTVAGYIPRYGLPAPVVEPSSTLAEWIEKVSPGFWERSAGGVA